MKRAAPLLALLFCSVGAGWLPAESGPTPPPLRPSLLPPAYQGRPFDNEAYRKEQQAEADLPRQPYHAFKPSLVAWDSKSPVGTGWVGREEPAASIRLDAADPEGRRTIHYQVVLNNYRYAVFGWQFAGPPGQPVDLRTYDAVSFDLKVTGPKKPQELFFGVSEAEPAPLSLREYDPEFADGSWHHITIPVRAMKWTGPSAAKTEVRGFVFKTFVWDPSDFSVQLDHFTFDQAVGPVAPMANFAADIANRGQVIPGTVECAFYDLGGEGVAYHDTTPLNILSGVLNQQRGHQRAHATAYHWNFRREEGVDISFTKDWADLNHPNLVDPPVNQLYVGGTEDGEWCNYTVDVRQAGTYSITALYGNVAETQPLRFSLNGQPACTCTAPVVTGSMHKWNKAVVGTIAFAQSGVQLLTLHYGRGWNLGSFEFVKVSVPAANTAK